MKIVINAVSAKMGGSVSYIINLLRHLSVMEGDFQFIAFLPPETAAKLEGISRNIEVITTRIGHAGMLKRMVWEQVALRRFLKNRCADVLFSTANFGMFRCPVRQILLVRNALYFSQIYCETFLPKHSLQFRIAFKMRRWLICQSAKAADTVMAPTQAMLDELRSVVDVKQTVVNPYGITPVERTEARSDNVLQCPNSIEGRIIRLLYVSLYSEHKNLSTLLNALPLLNANGAVKFHLKTTANPGWTGAAWTLTHQGDLRLARQPGVAGHVEFVGPLSREETEKLYPASDIFVFPSLTESFGFPMAEAMLHGMPIVAADTPVNREICGDCAVYFDPLSSRHLADRLLELVADSSLCNRMRAKGPQKAVGRFSWGRHTKRIMEAAHYPGPEILDGYGVASFAR